MVGTIRVYVFETRGEQFLETVDSAKASEFGFARLVAVARMPRPRDQKQMVFSRRESTIGTDRTQTAERSH
jgi:hypothetical protein